MASPLIGSLSDVYGRRAIMITTMVRLCLCVCVCVCVCMHVYVVCVRVYFSVCKHILCVHFILCNV